MRTRTYDLLKRLETYPVFTLDDVSSIIDKDPPYSTVLVHRLVKRGLIRKVHRNRYTMHDDPFVIATNLVWPSYISSWSALRYHDLTTQVPSEITVMMTANRHTNHFEYGGSVISFHRIPARYLFGYSKVPISGFEVFMADREKAILDSVLFRMISLSEVIDILTTNRDDLSIERLVEYAVRAGNGPASKRIGWVLEKLNLPGSKILKGSVRGAMIPLDHTRPMEGRKDIGWGVIENMEVAV